MVSTVDVDSKFSIQITLVSRKKGMFIIFKLTTFITSFYNIQNILLEKTGSLYIFLPMPRNTLYAKYI